MIKDYKDHNDWKTHLNSLPIIDEFPKWQGYSDFACLIIPVFSFDGSTEYVKKYLAKSAAWSLKTWKENSDAFLLNIPCFIYVEANIADATLPILFENGVSEEHIKIVNYSNTEWLAKCLQPIFDESLETYDYIVISDLDLFALRSQKNEPLRFFENIKKHRPDGFGCKVFNDSLPTYWMPRMSQLFEYKYGKDTFKGDLVDEWCKTLESVVGNESDLRKYIDGGETDSRPWTGIMIIESGIFKDKRQIEKICKTLGEDEASIYAWSKLSEDNHCMGHRGYWDRCFC